MDLNDKPKDPNNRVLPNENPHGQGSVDSTGPP